MVDRFVDHVVTGDLAAIAIGHGTDMLGKQALRLLHRIGPVIVLVQPVGKPLRPVPQQRVTAQGKIVRLREGGDAVHSGEIIDVGRRAHRLPFHLVFRHDHAAFGLDQFGIARVLDAARIGPARGGGDGAAEPAAAALCDGVQPGLREGPVCRMALSAEANTLAAPPMHDASGTDASPAKRRAARHFKTSVHSKRSPRRFFANWRNCHRQKA